MRTVKGLRTDCGSVSDVVDCKSILRFDHGECARLGHPQLEKFTSFVAKLTKVENMLSASYIPTVLSTCNMHNNLSDFE